ncbi:ABC transporter substrate-binding protein [Celeribacter indicus]|uniref:ABC transporter periplasmic protein n=1 Tax=Celeribacter indicus TaxID=1208324 RepID=A0A0B5DV02_9RHOB|nr:ABC transporter substrate-binding protein [Celeribacter indicus]AJE46854.1 ABC transporter periplasmic protein [Celeribacter indicus]SDW80228.1 NitT/TauT family transport system substrate-binding protein [Celeribacter indicus]
MTYFRTLALGTALALGPIAAQADTLVFGWSPNPQTPQVDVALEKDYFTEAGVEVEIVPFDSGRAAFEALLGGQVDVAFMAEFPAATGALTGQEFAIVGDLARFTGSRLIGNSDAGPLDSPADLAGRRIGTTIGTNVHFFLDTLLSEAGVEAEIVSAAPPDLVPAVTRGDVEAIVPFPTFYSAAQETLGEKYTELRPESYQVHYILAATPEMVGDRAATLDAFMGALAKADADVAADPEAAMAAVSASMNGAMSPEALAAMWQDVEIGLTLDDGLTDLILAEAEWILAQGVVRAEPLSRAAVEAIMAPQSLEKATR